MQGEQTPSVHSGQVRECRDKPEFPNPAEQADNLLLHLGVALKSLGDSLPWEYVNTLTAKVGAHDVKSAVVLLRELETYGLVSLLDQFDEPTDASFPSAMRLTLQGWQRYEELKRERKDTKRAFMAFPFPDNERPETILVETAYRRFKEAVKETGFHLENPLLDSPEAGLIPARMLVEIRNAKFLVADLTDQNLGAYWEAGAAVGMGLPVIYTCHEDHFEDIHFDTRQMQTIAWSEETLDEAAEQLKAIIRNTFPEEAIMEDSPKE